MIESLVKKHADVVLGGGGRVVVDQSNIKVRLPRFRLG